MQMLFVASAEVANRGGGFTMHALDLYLSRLIEMYHYLTGSSEQPNHFCMLNSFTCSVNTINPSADATYTLGTDSCYIKLYRVR